MYTFVIVILTIATVYAPFTAYYEWRLAKASRSADLEAKLATAIINSITDRNVERVIDGHMPDPNYDDYVAQFEEAGIHVTETDKRILRPVFNQRF